MSAQSEMNETATRRFEAAERATRRRTRMTVGILIAGVVYLLIAWAAFDVSGVLSRAEPERASSLAQDSVSHKIFVVRDLRRGEWVVSVENQTAAGLTEDPPWLSRSDDGAEATVDLGEGVVVRIRDERVVFTVPEYGEFDIGIDGRELEPILPDRIYEEERAHEPQLIADRAADYRLRQLRLADGAFAREVDETEGAFTRFALRAERWLTGLFTDAENDPAFDPPAEELERIEAFYADKLYTPWLSISGNTLDARIRWDARIRIVAGSRIEVQRGQYGWEHFFFDTKSPLRDVSFGDAIGLAFNGDRVDPARSNAELVWSEFLRNEEWQHNDTFQKLFETFLMAFLGTFFAAFFGLPLAFLAAKNFTPLSFRISAPIVVAFAPIRFVTRRFFDFVRGIDMLIWSLLFNNAFGLGPLTGALAIAFTDTGTLGKLFSEALENVDKRQIEGVAATGASQVQRYRFGVIPQILPVFISQSLYYFESNIRSATIIGALGAGGIGLALALGIATQQRWEYVLFLIILIVVLVIAVDLLSGWLRRRLIEGGARRASATGAVIVGLAGASLAYLFGLDFFAAEWWIFTLAFAAIFLGLMVLTLWLIARSRRDRIAAAGVLAGGERA